MDRLRDIILKPSHRQVMGEIVVGFGSDITGAALWTYEALNNLNIYPGVVVTMLGVILTIHGLNRWGVRPK